MPCEVLFYHLQGQPVAAALPMLLEKTLQRGWRALIRAGSAEMLDMLDQTLWTYSDQSFLPHGSEADGEPESQPILLSLADTRINAPQVIFLVDRAPLPAELDVERLVLLFDGEDPEALAQAREAWQDIKARGLLATYWQQQDGRWVKKA